MLGILIGVSRLVGIKQIVYDNILCNGSWKIPPGKIPTRKIPTHQTPPRKISPQKIPNQKISTWSIPTHFINCFSSLFLHLILLP